MIRGLKRESMIGIKTNESEKFIKFFQIVQSEAQKQGCVYYLDAGDGRDFENDEYEGEDLMGWLIPLEEVPKFEQEWNIGDVSDKWSRFYTWAVWSVPDNPTIKFENPSAMTVESYKYILARILERAFESIEEANKNNSDFDNGRKLAYYEVADIIKSELYVRDEKLSEYGLDIDLEKAFGSK
jgi:hypothetical protein